MRFSEHELTLAVTTAATAAHGSRHRRVDPEQAWAALSPIERYHRLDVMRDQIMPALLALPEIEVIPGARPTFTDAQIGSAVTQTLGENVGWLRRRAIIGARTSLLKIALAGLPARQDPDTLVVPDVI